MVIERIRAEIPEVLLPFLDLYGDAYLTGGAIVRVLRGEEPSDWDVWCLDVGPLEGALEEAGYENRDANGSRNMRTLWTDGDGTTVDLIGHSFGAPPKVCGRFDFRCCMVATDGRNLWAADGALEDIAMGRLVPMRQTEEGRIEKYEARGFVLDVDRRAAVLPESSTVDQRLGSDPLRVTS